MEVVWRVGGEGREERKGGREEREGRRVNPRRIAAERTDGGKS